MVKPHRLPPISVSIKAVQWLDRYWSTLGRLVHDWLFQYSIVFSICNYPWDDDDDPNWLHFFWGELKEHQPNPNLWVVIGWIVWLLLMVRVSSKSQFFGWFWMVLFPISPPQNAMDAMDHSSFSQPLRVMTWAMAAFFARAIAPSLACVARRGAAGWIGGRCMASKGFS